MALPLLLLEAVDKEIPRRAILRRRMGIGVRLAGVGLLGAAALVAAGGALRASVRRSDVRTGVARRSSLDAVIEATGTVEPRRESVLAAPSETHVLELVAAVGQSVSPGDPLVVLDGSAGRLEVERLERQIALKANERERARLQHEQELVDLAAEEKVAALSLEAHQRHAARDRRLRELGLVVEDAVRESEALVAKTAIELERLRSRRAQARAALHVRLQALDLEHAILEKERDQARMGLDQMTVRADARGVVTWLVPTVGAALHRGDEVARIADLAAFKVAATLSDVHAPSVRAGQPASVVAGGATLEGSVEQIRPTVDDGTLSLTVRLSDPAHAALRPNLRVDVRLVTAHRADTLVVPSAPFTLADGSTAAWVVKGGRAVRTPVRLGITGHRGVEILEGLTEGDEVLLRDMTEYGSLEEVRIR